jgi:DNA-binding MarR family transcriptional regulator
MKKQQDDPQAAHALALAGELRVLLGKLRRRMREQTHPGDFTWSQKSVLLRLERDGPATVTALARAEGVRPQSMGATVSILEAAGLVGGKPDPTDGRQTILSVTASCLEMLRAGRAAREDWLFHAIQGNFAPQEYEALARAVELLKRLIDSQAR